MSLSHEKESMMGKLRLVAGPFVGREMKQVVFCQSQDFDIKTGKKGFIKLRVGTVKRSQYFIYRI